MYRLFALAGSIALVSFAASQPPVEVSIEPRYSIPANARLFPQTDPKAALTSAVKAIEAGRYDYLVAHLMDEKFIEGRITERAKLFEPEADRDLRALRDRQRKDLGLDKRLQLPDDPNEFSQSVKAEARLRAFRQVCRDVDDKFNADPTTLKELRRFLREGDVVPDANTARVSIKAVKDRAVFLKRNGDRWFVENRQAEEKPAEKPTEK